MGMFTSSGVTVSIAAAVTTVPADATAYAALTWTQIKNVENPGDIGDTEQEAPIDTLENRRTQYFKGQLQGAQMQIVVGLDDADAGQQALEAAELDYSAAVYPIKVTYPNKRNAGGTDAIRYFCGKVFRSPEQPGAANNVVRRTYTVRKTTDTVKVASTAGA